MTFFSRVFVSIGLAFPFGVCVSVVFSFGLDSSSFAWFVGGCVGAESPCFMVVVAVSFGSWWICSSSSDSVSVAKSSSLRKGVNNLA